jgi:hypothetical protein
VPKRRSKKQLPEIRNNLRSIAQQGGLTLTNMKRSPRTYCFSAISQPADAKKCVYVCCFGSGEFIGASVAGQHINLNEQNHFVPDPDIR